MIEINEIITERFKLRKVVESDNESIFSILSDNEVVRFLNIEKISTVSDVDTLIRDYMLHHANGDKFPFAITDKNSGEFAGVFLIKLDLYNPDAFEFTVYIKRDFWNRGIYSEVLPYMTDFVFKEIGVSNFRGYIMISNEASEIVLKKHGFVLEKTFDVDGLSEKIKSYLMTKEIYFNQQLSAV